MSIQKSLSEMKQIQEDLLYFLENDNNSELNYIDLRIISNDQYKLKSLLRLISKISNNHHRNTAFKSKIKEIFNFFKDKIKECYSNYDIFNIFKSNKLLILILIEEKIIIIDERIMKKLVTEKYIDLKYPHFLATEIKPFLTEKFIKQFRQNKSILTSDKWISEVNSEQPADFELNRQKGQNHNYICQMIQDDLVEDFISYINKNNISLRSYIGQSIYETNSFLLKKKWVTLIEYAAFCGSIQIFQYLRLNGVQLKPSLWFYTIHSDNAELIHILEEHNVKPEDVSFFKCLIESIKCHHNNIAEYIQNNYINEPDVFLIESVKYYNFKYMKVDFLNSFFYFCKYDYYWIADTLIKEADKTDLVNCNIIFFYNFNDIKKLNISMEFYFSF